MTTCGIGGWGGPLPGDPSNDIVLVATSAFGGIDLTWSYPSTNPYAVAYVKVFRGLSSNFANAFLVKEVAGSYYFDKLAVVAVYYYWIQVVSINGTIATTVGPSNALSKLTITGLIEQLTGVINEGLLATSLTNKLDQISILNLNLTQEILDRQGGETTLAAAMADVALDVAEAHTFILAETASRVSANSALVAQVNGVVATLGGDIAAVDVSLSASINAVDATVDALYVAKITVNDLVGGFGLHNNGSVVEAGFDVDTFWVGRTALDKIKPFIISGGIVYIQEAVIPILTADKIDTRNLTIKDGAGTVLFGSGTSLDYTRINPSSGWLNSALTPSITTAQNTANTANTAAGTAQTAANTAQTGANTANTAITNIASDSILSPGEKPQVKLDYDTLIAEQAGIDAQATSYSITTEKTTYDTAVSALTTYLGTLTGWNTIPGSDVVIVGTTFRTKFGDVYTSRQALLNKVAAEAGLRATWASVTGANKPADNATKNLVYNQSGTPSGVEGDVWNKTQTIGGVVTTVASYVYTAGAWKETARAVARLYHATSATVWADSLAVAALAAVGLTARIGDVVTAYNVAAKWSETHILVDNYSIGWGLVTSYFTGNVLIDGSLAADKIIAGSITAAQISANTITTDRIVVGAASVASNSSAASATANNPAGSSTCSIGNTSIVGLTCTGAPVVVSGTLALYVTHITSTAVESIEFTYYVYRDATQIAGPLTLRCPVSSSGATRLIVPVLVRSSPSAAYHDFAVGGSVSGLDSAGATIALSASQISASITAYFVAQENKV